MTKIPCNKVKTAVIGCGMISNIYLKNLTQLFYIIDVVAVCDIRPEAAEEKAKQYGIARTMTLEEIAASDEIELVVNLTAPDAHYDVIRMMLESGKHVYTEKIFTPELEQSRELAALAQSKGLYLSVAPDTVLGAGVQTAKKVLEAGLIGEVTSGFVCINRNQSLNSELFRMLRGNGGALPYDVGIYYVATLLTLLGPVKAIRAFGAPAPEHERELFYLGEPGESWRLKRTNLISASLQFECGALVSVLFDGNSVNAEQRTITLLGTEGVLKAGNPDSFNGEVTLIRPESGECVVPFTHGYDGKDTLGATPFDKHGHRGVGAADLAWALRTGRKEIRCSKEYGLHCQEVLSGMEQAAETGETVYPQSRFVMKALKSGYYSTTFGGAARGDAERSLME